VSHVVCSNLAYAHPGGDLLFSEVAFRISPGRHVGLVGTNGVGKSTLFGVLAGELQADEGEVSLGGRVALMPQDVGAAGDARTVRELLLSFAPGPLRAAGEAMRDAERRLEAGDDAAGMALGTAIADWSDLGGYELEGRWDAACRRIVRAGLPELADRPAVTLSGGERKRLVLDVLFASDADVLLLDEPDNFLDVPAKEALERQIAGSKKTVCLISHDREVLSGAVDAILTLEAAARGCTAARTPRIPRPGRTASGAWATRSSAGRTRSAGLRELVRTVQGARPLQPGLGQEGRRGGEPLAALARRRPPAAPRGRPAHQGAGCAARTPPGASWRIREAGHRRARRAVLRRGALRRARRPHRPQRRRQDPSHAAARGEEEPDRGAVVLGPASRPASSRSSTPAATLRPTVLDAVEERLPRRRRDGRARRYGLAEAARRSYDVLSGGQKARLEILCLELEGHNLLLLDEPTDNLDIDSSEALETALDGFQGDGGRRLPRPRVPAADGPLPDGPPRRRGLALPDHETALAALARARRGPRVRLAKDLSPSSARGRATRTPASRA
jgi:ABC-type multidrug transport system ATPase subunit